MRRITIHEVGPRDGLQMEQQVVPLEIKLGWIRRLMDSGVDIIQVGSFVHPAKVPQMADTDDLFRRLTADKRTRVVLSGLVLNEKGLERGLACGVEMFCMGASASETHSRKNSGMGTDEALRRIIGAARQAEAAGADERDVVLALRAQDLPDLREERVDVVADAALAAHLNFENRLARGLVVDDFDVAEL